MRDRFAPRALTAGVTLTATGGGTATGDSDRLVQAVANLVDNALRVTPQGGRITIAAAPGALTVDDTGPGLADPATVWEPFARPRTASDGSGLGLAIVRSLVEAMGGTARAEPAADGRGARFVLSLGGP